MQETRPIKAKNNVFDLVIYFFDKKVLSNFDLIFEKLWL